MGMLLSILRIEVNLHLVINFDASSFRWTLIRGCTAHQRVHGIRFYCRRRLLVSTLEFGLINHAQTFLITLWMHYLFDIVKVTWLE